MDHPRLKSEHALFDMRHARARALERYDLRLTEADYWALVDQCLAGNQGPARWVASPNKRTTVFRVQHIGKWLVAVYRKDTKTIRTFLPPHAKVQHRRLKGRGVLPIQVMRRGDG